MSDVVVPFVYALRSRKLAIGVGEVLALGRALSLGLHGASLDGFYFVARSLLVHREQDLDAFDQAFLAHFGGVAQASLAIAREVLEWLRDPRRAADLTEEERAALAALDMEETRRMLEERLREQRERHDGGSRWVGTGGTSPFGSHGEHPSGIRLGEGGGRSAMGVASARAFAGYRDDVTLDVRQIEVALRRLRSWLREGAADELDVDGTIDATARSGGELDIKLRPPKRSDVRVALFMDIGGSMDPYSHLVSQLFSAAKRASNVRSLESYYFHNCIYGRVYKTESFREPIRAAELFERLDARWRVVFVGDAAMHPAELLGASPWDTSLVDRAEGARTGLGWITAIAERFPRSVWLNPDPPGYWDAGTAEVIKRVVPMYHLSIEGLRDAVRALSRKR